MVLAKPFDSLSATDLADLVRDRLEEGVRLEFKSELDLSKEKDKKEMAKDVSAMANTSGGLILYGIAEAPSGANGRVVADRIVPLADATVVQRIDNIIATGTTPPVRARIRAIDVPDGVVGAIEVPQSDWDLHMASSYGDSRYYKRTEKSAMPMTEIEVRRAYERIDRLRTDAEGRIQTVLQEEARISGNWVSVFTIPLAAPVEEIDILGFKDTGVWLTGMKVARHQDTYFHLVHLKPSGAGLDAVLPADVMISEASYLFRLRRDGALHLGSPLSSPLVDPNRLNTFDVLRNVLNACLWAHLVNRKAGIRGPARLVVRIPSDKDLQVGGGEETIVAPMVLRREGQHIVIQQTWTPTDDLDSRIAVARCIFDKVWQRMGRERCDLYFNGTGALQSAVVPRLGL